MSHITSTPGPDPPVAVASPAPAPGRHTDAMTEVTAPLPEEPAEAAPTAAPVNVTRLLAEAASKSSILWIRLPDGAAHPAWFVWHDNEDPRGTGPAAYVVSGLGEQPLPWLPAQVDLLLRSKDTGGRLITITAEVAEVTPESPVWDAAVEVIRPARLNLQGSPAEVEARWRAGCTIHVLTPHGRPHEQPGSYAVGSGARAVSPAKGTTIGWRPWHLFGRPATRRGTR